MDKFLSFFTRDNITLCLAIFGSIGTFLGLYRNRFAIKLTYRSQLVPEHSKIGIMWFDFLIENCSSLPVSISRIFISINGVSGEFLHEKYRVSSSTENMCGPTETTSIYTIPLPSKIEGYGAIGGYFRLQLPNFISEQELIESNVVITLVTNRGKRKFQIHPEQSSMDILTSTGIHPYHN